VSGTCTEAAPRTRPPRNPLTRAQAGIGLALAVLTVAAWALMLNHGAPFAGSGAQGQGASMDHADAMTPTMGLGAVLFLAVWIAMVAAMMFPAVAPTILMYARVSANRRAGGKSWAPTSMFVAGYVLLWTALGAIAFVLATAGEALAARVDVVGDNAARIGALLIVTAGVYQFSALKERCLTECRSPLAFLAQHWRDGDRGALAMGVHHGLHCAGCCWALMAMLFPLGMMNVAALGAVTAFIYAEKALPGGKTLRYAAGAALIAFGACAFLDPGLLPGATGHAGHSMAG
jgi:predicted metal-binding membrane protein